MATSDEHVLAVLATLEDCRVKLQEHGRADTAELVSIAVLDLRMKLKGIADAELRALCEEVMRSDDERARDGMAGSAVRPRPPLRLVK